MFKFTSILGALGHALLAGAEHLEGTPAGAAVVTDARKTLSDAGSAAVNLVQQGATQPAIDALSPALTKIGIPAGVATPLASYAVAQGESFLSQLVAKL